MNELQIFKNEDFGEVRIIEKDGQPWFIAKDACDCLGLSNVTVVLQRLDPDEVTKLNLGGLSGETNLVNEYGLFNLILASRKKEARQFKRWVTHEVLPSIRKHGMYATDELLDNPDLFIQVITALKDERQKTKALTFEIKVKDQQIIEMKPKATYYDLILQCPSLLSMTEISKDYGKSAKWMNEKLHELGIQYNQSKVWFLYQKHAGFGYTQTKTHNYADSEGKQQGKPHMYWTQKGRLFIYEVLKKEGIVPTIERDVA